MIPEDVSETTGPAHMQLVPLTGHLTPVLAVAFSPDGSLLASTACDGRVILWDTASGSIRRVRQEENVSFGATRWAAFSPDGQTLATNERGVVQHNVATGRWEGTFPNAGTILGFRPTGQVLVTLGADTPQLSDSASGQVLQEIPLGVTLYAVPPAAALSGDGESVVTGLEEAGRVRLQVWDLTSGTLRMQRLVPRTFKSRCRHPVTGERRVVKQGHGGVECLALSPDGRFLAVGGDFTLWICDTHTGRLTHRLLRASQRTHSLAFSPDGRLVAAGTNRG